MRISLNNPWRTHPHHSGFVGVGTHSLWATVRGPTRSTHDPLLIFITGAGASSATYVKLQQSFGTHLRVLFYDRAGYDKSTLPPLYALPEGKIYALDTARDLSKLLRATELEPPYIIMSHSYGGIIARSFLELHKTNLEAISGMILVDSGTELMFQLFPRIPSKELAAVAENVDWNLLTHLKEQSGMSDAEWEYAIEAQKRCERATELEDTHASAHQLAVHHQLERQALGSKPLLVLKFNMAKDYQMLYDAGIKNGDGTAEEREKACVFVKTFELFHDQIAKSQCSLSENARFKVYNAFGHDLPMRRPSIIVQEVNEFLQCLKMRKNTHQVDS